MKKLLKILLWIAGVIVALFILAFIGLKIFLPAEKIRQIAESRATEQLGRPVTVESIDISIWGGLGIELNRVEIANAEGFGEQPMLSAEFVDLKLEIIPLLSSNFQIDRLIIKNPTIALAKNTDGKNNFTFEKAEEKMPPQVVEKLTPEAKAAAVSLAFDRLQIVNGALTYTDDSTHQSYHAEKLNLTTALTESDGRYRTSGELGIGTLTVDIGHKLPQMDIALEYDAEYNLTGKMLSLEEAELTINGVRFEIRSDIKDPFGKLALNGNLKAESIDVKNILGFFSKEQLSALEGFELDGQFSLDADLQYDSHDEQPLDYSGTAVVSDMQLTRNDIDGRFQFKRALIDFKPDNLRMNIEDGSFNDRPFKGHLTVDDFEDPELSGELSGSLSLIFLQPFLPVEGEHKLGGDADFDLTFFGRVSDYTGMGFSGSVRIDGGSYNSRFLPEPIEQLDLDAYFDNDLLNIRKLTTRTASGQLEFSARLNYLMPYLLADEKQRVRIKPEVNQSHLKGEMNLALVNDFLPQKGAPKMTGKARVDLSFTGRAGDYGSMKPYGAVEISNASYTDSLLPEPIQAFDARFVIVPDTITVENFRAEFVSSDIAFEGRLSQPFPYLLPFESIDRRGMKKPYFDFVLNSDKLDVDRLFPEAVPGSKAEGEPVASSDSVSMLILPDIDGGGTFAIDTLIYSQINFSQVAGKVSIRDRKIDCYDVTGLVYGGDVAGKTTIDLTDFANPHYVGEFKANDVQANDVMTRFSKFGGYLSGKLNVSGDYSATGWEPEQFLNSLTMDGKSSMKSGQLKTTGTVYTALSKLAESTGNNFSESQTLRDLVSNIKVADGKVRLDAFSTSLGEMGDVTVDGFYAFSGDLNYDGSILLSKEWSKSLLSKGGLLGGLSNIFSEKSTERIKLPLSIGGSVDKPSVKLDASSVLKEAKDNLIKEGSKDLLKNLIGGGKK